MKRWMALLAALLLCATALAEGTARELSGCFGKDIAQAAAELGGLSHSEGAEFKDNYVSDTLALRGSDGKVCLIELNGGADSLCGVTVGMARKDVLKLMDGCPMLWQYDEEIAWIVRADAQNELNSETLVVFFDEKGRVEGAWYRASGA